MHPRFPSLATWLMVSTATPLLAKDYYMAPDGKDTNAGSFAAPFATILRSQQSAGPGDTVFIRGGTYKMSEAQITRQTDQLLRLSGGTAGLRFQRGQTKRNAGDRVPRQRLG